MHTTPYRRLGLCVAALSAAVGTFSFARGSAGKPAAARMPAVVVAGVRWEGSLETAKARARREQKPILLLSMFGRLDEVFC